MIENLPKKRFWELYKKLPAELQDALFSDELGENVLEICERYGAAGQLGLVQDGVTEVLLGVLPPNEFLEELEKKLTVEKPLVKKIVHELNRFVFFPVKAELENVYNLQLTPIAGKDSPSPNASVKSAYQEPIQ
jgi:hypothetical protein